MNSKSDPLFVSWCSREAARFAVENWHYSKKLPHQKLAHFGIWEKSNFVGSIVFGDGANANLFTPYGLTMDEGVELVRVAMRKHETAVSQSVTLAIRQLRLAFPKLKLIVSFADPEMGHAGGIYKAGGWLYFGKTTCADEYMVKGVRMHGRAIRSTRATFKKTVAASNTLDWIHKALDPSAYKVTGSSKHRYLMPLDRDLLRKLKAKSLPYPRAVPSGGSPSDRETTFEPITAL